MKKLLLLVFMLAVLAFCVACGGSSTDTDTNSNVNTDTSSDTDTSVSSDTDTDTDTDAGEEPEQNAPTGDVNVVFAVVAAALVLTVICKKKIFA